jgi:hypothetical protein
MLARPEAIPFTTVCRLFPVVEATLVSTTLDVAITPFTELVSMLPILLRLLLVLATARVTDVVATTPLIVEVKSPVEVEYVSVLLPITEDVAVTPLIDVVSVFPVSDWVNEFIIFAKLETTPLITVDRVFPLEVAALEVMTLDVATEPPTFEDSVLPVTTTELGTDRLVTARLVVVAFVAVTLLRAAVPVAVKLPVFVVPKFATDEKRFVKVPVNACKTELTRFVKESDSAVVVPLSFTSLSSLMLVVATMPLIILVNIFVEVAKELLLELTAVVVAMLPFTVEVIMFPEDVSVLVVEVEIIPPTLVQTGAPEEFIVKTCPASPAASSAAVLLALPTNKAF